MARSFQLTLSVCPVPCVVCRVSCVVRCALCVLHVHMHGVSPCARVPVARGAPLGVVRKGVMLSMTPWRTNTATVQDRTLTPLVCPRRLMWGTGCACLTCATSSTKSQVDLKS